MAKDEKPEDYKGARTPIQMEIPCGFCNAADHHMCKHELPYYEKLWICGCECNKGWKPIDLGGVTPEKRRKKDEVRTMPVSGEAGQPPQVDGPPGDLLPPTETESLSGMEEWRDNSDIKSTGGGDEVPYGDS